MNFRFVRRLGINKVVFIDFQKHMFISPNHCWREFVNETMYMTSFKIFLLVAKIIQVVMVSKLPFALFGK